MPEPDGEPPGIGAADLARRMDFVRQVHTNVTENIKLADTKAGFIAAAAAALLNVVALRARTEWALAAANLDAQPLLLGIRVLLFLMAVAGCVAALLCAYFALRPRIPVAPSYVAFPALARMSAEQYLSQVEGSSDPELIAELTRDTIALAVIGVQKTKMVGRGITPLIISAIGAALLLLVG